MNSYNLISSKTVIGELISDFNITNDDSINKIQRHVARAMGIMEVDGYHEIAFHIDNIREFRCPLPCDNKYLAAVLTNVNGIITRLPLTRDLALGLDFSQIATHSTYRGRINFNYLKTNFQEARVLFIYYRLPKDANNFLMIPDNDYVLEALPFFVIYKLSLSGYKHPVIDIKTADAKWNSLYPKARNNVNFPSIEEMHRFTQMNNNPLFLNIINEEWKISGEDILQSFNGLV